MIAAIVPRTVGSTETTATSADSTQTEAVRLDAKSFVELAGDSVRLLDGEIDDAVRRARAETADAQRVSSQIAALQAVEGALERAKKADDDVVATKDLAVPTAEGVVHADALLRQAGLPIGDSVSLRTLKTKVDELESARSAITQGQELRQLRLQELLGERAHLLEQTSNLLRSMNDTLKSLIGNLR